MLKGNFYTVVNSSGTTPGCRKSVLLIHKEHAIFSGHFPGLPIVPGVCMMQIVKEQLEDEVQRTLHLVSSANIKFLSLINPQTHPQIEVKVDYQAVPDGYLAEGSISVGDTLFFKIIKASYR